MAVDERRRSELSTGLAATLGQEAAATMFELLPTQEELATRADVRRIDQHLVDIDRRFEQIDQRFEQVDRRFDELEARLAQRIDDRIDGLRHELLAAFRGELVTAVAGQTRAVIVATATATFGIGGLAVTLAQLL